MDFKHNYIMKTNLYSIRAMFAGKVTPYLVNSTTPERAQELLKEYMGDILILSTQSLGESTIYDMIEHLTEVKVYEYFGTFTE